MSEVLQANIFFFITSIAVVVFTLLLCIVVYQVIKILKVIRRIIDRIDEGSEVIAEDIEHFRAYVSEGSLVSQLIHFFLGQRPRPSRSHRKKRSGTKLAVKDE